jgi:hypothetical protein
METMSFAGADVAGHSTTQPLYLRGDTTIGKRGNSTEVSRKKSLFSLRAMGKVVDYRDVRRRAAVSKETSYYAIAEFLCR